MIFFTDRKNKLPKHSISSVKIHICGMNNDSVERIRYHLQNSNELENDQNENQVLKKKQMSHHQ